MHRVVQTHSSSSAHVQGSSAKAPTVEAPSVHMHQVIDWETVQMHQESVHMHQIIVNMHLRQCTSTEKQCKCTEDQYTCTSKSAHAPTAVHVY